MLNTYLYHHGILGMHWGIRRYQNKNGKRTSLGKKHREITDRNSSGFGKKLLKDAALTAGIAAAAYTYTVNKDAIDAYIKQYANVALDKMGSTGTTIRTGKKYISEAFSSTKTAVGSVGKAIKDVRNATSSVKKAGNFAKGTAKTAVGSAVNAGKYAVAKAKKFSSDVKYDKEFKKMLEESSNSDTLVKGSSLEKFVEPSKASKVKEKIKDTIYDKTLSAKQAAVRRAHGNKDGVNPNVPGTSLEGFYERKKIKQPSGLEKYAKNTAAKYLIGGTAITAATKIAEKKFSNKKKKR